MSNAMTASHVIHSPTRGHADLIKKYGTTCYKIGSPSFDEVVKNLVSATSKSTRNLLLSPDFSTHSTKVGDTLLVVVFPPEQLGIPSLDLLPGEIFNDAYLRTWSWNNLKTGVLSTLPISAAVYMRLAWEKQPPGRVWVGHELTQIGSQRPFLRLDSHKSGYKTLRVSSYTDDLRLNPQDSIALRFKRFSLG